MLITRKKPHRLMQAEFERAKIADGQSSYYKDALELANRIDHEYLKAKEACLQSGSDQEVNSDLDVYIYADRSAALLIEVARNNGYFKQIKPNYVSRLSQEYVDMYEQPFVVCVSRQSNYSGIPSAFYYAPHIDEKMLNSMEIT